MASKKSKKSTSRKKRSKKSTSKKKSSKRSKSAKKKSTSSKPGKKESGDSGKDPDDLTRLNIQLPEKGPGRRTLLTPELMQAIVTVIQAGNYAKTACQYAGIGESTFYRWLERGEEELKRLIDHEIETGEYLDPEPDEAIYVEFWESVKKAEAKSEVAAVLAVKSAWKGDWKAAMTYLERKFPDHWRRRDRTEITDGEGNPFQPVRIYMPDNGRD